MVRLLPFILLSWGSVTCRPGINSTESSLLVELHTGACFGYCPVIRLSVYANGAVEYEGKQFAERQGRATFQLTPDEMHQLRRQLRKTNLWQYPDRIDSNVIDAPWSTLTTTKRGKTKSVVGTIDRPKPLLDLENLMHNLAEHRGYQTRRGVPPGAVE